MSFPLFCHSVILSVENFRKKIFYARFLHDLVTKTKSFRATFFVKETFFLDHSIVEKRPAKPVKPMKPIPPVRPFDPWATWFT